MTPGATLADRLDRQRRAHLCEGPPSAAVRRHRIDRLMAMLADNCDELSQAISADFGARSSSATILTEVMGISSAVEHTRSHLERWMRPRRPVPGARALGIRAEVQPTPKGVVGIIGPWNFPVNLVALPAAEAFSAGNRVMIKMSEVTARTADTFAALASRYFEPDELDVVIGGVDVAAEFAALPFDHLFFTGSPSIGRLVQRAASENLVPVTLELGGKNPVVVAADADIARSAARIARGRLVNGGQACVCPDYVFVLQHKVDEFVGAASAAYRQMFPSIVGNTDYCSSVNEPNYRRVLALLDDARDKGAHIFSVAPSHEVLPDDASRKIAPTLVTNVDPGMRIASEEVFGPVLVVMGYQDLDEVIAYVNEHPSPLVAYWYGRDDHNFRKFVRSTRTGGVARNDFALQMSFSETPFGGVGRSGMGAYHGKSGFDTFSHHRSVVGSDLPFSVTGIAAPPFSRSAVMIGKLSIRSMSRRARRRINTFAQRRSSAGQ